MVILWIPLVTWINRIETHEIKKYYVSHSALSTWRDDR
jgi:hypothetical protein